MGTHLGPPTFPTTPGMHLLPLVPRRRRRQETLFSIRTHPMEVSLVTSSPTR